jgi:hypothetical protein
VTRTWRRRAAVAGAVAAALLAAAVLLGLLLRPRIEAAVADRLAREAGRFGAVAKAGAVSVSLWPPLVLRDVHASKAGQWTLTLDHLAVRPRLSLRGARLLAGRARFVHRSGLELQTAPSVWDVAQVDGARRAALVGSPGRLEASWQPGETSRLHVQADELPAGTFVSVLRNDRPLVDPGLVGGTLEVTSSSSGLSIDLDARGRGLRLAALSEPIPGLPTEATFGEPTDLAVRLEASWQPARGLAEIGGFRVLAGGADVTGRMTLSDLGADPRLDLAVNIPRVEFARLLGASGIEATAALTYVKGVAGANDLGSASLVANARGRIRDARSFVVSQRLDFVPPPRPIPALTRLLGDFDHEVTSAAGHRMRIAVSPTSPDFIALADLPPLFVKTLLLAEDSGFFGHRGIDLSEIPAAVITNWERGGVARGASTITQQLAKNLFLSRDKRLGRKLQELCLALLLESTLPKERILEIYLNVIEWGPELYGLRPAARRYFDKDPKDLTPREMAFLVSLIPGPVKYQRSFANGTLSAGFRPLVDDLLAKVHSVGALTDEEYEKARTETLLIRTPPVP